MQWLQKSELEDSDNFGRLVVCQKKKNMQLPLVL